MIGMEKYPRRAELIVAQKDDSGNLIVLNLNDGNYYTLDPVGAKVWELCDGTFSVSQIVTILCQEYDVSAETVNVDVIELLRDLANEQLVVEGQQTLSGVQATA